MSWKVKIWFRTHDQHSKQQHSPGPPPGECIGGGMMAFVRSRLAADQ
jgi:hypothetical protein